MQVTATEAKNRLGQMLEHCQREPVTIEKSGRRHSVLLSAAQYDAMLSEVQANKRPAPLSAVEFYAQHKEWVDAENGRFARIGLWNEEFRTW